MTNKHDHISGRPRDYISRKYFYRGRHRTGEFATDLIERIRSELGYGWKVSADGKYLYYEGTVYIPDTWPGPGFITVDPPDGLISLPALIEDK